MPGLAVGSYSESLMGGGSLYVLVSFTAFGPGFLPGMLATWLRVRAGVPQSERWPLLKSLLLGRAATVLLAGVVLPLLLATAGLAGSYFLSNGSSQRGLVALALLGGWIIGEEPRWLRSLALLSTWACYFGTLVFAVPLERKLGRLVYRGAVEDASPARLAHGIRAAYLVQGLVALLVWWEVHVR